MTDNWISTSAESDGCVRVARLRRFEDGVASFGIHDAQPAVSDDFLTRVTGDCSAHAPAEDVPGQHDSMDIFRVVAPESGEFAVSSLDYFTNQTESTGHVIGLLFDPDLTAQQQTHLNQFVTSHSCHFAIGASGPQMKLRRDSR